MRFPGSVLKGSLQESPWCVFRDALLLLAALHRRSGPVSSQVEGRGRARVFTLRGWRAACLPVRTRREKVVLRGQLQPESFCPETQTWGQAGLGGRVLPGAGACRLCPQHTGDEIDTQTRKGLGCPAIVVSCQVHRPPPDTLCAWPAAHMRGPARPVSGRAAEVSCRWPLGLCCSPHPPECRCVATAGPRGRRAIRAVQPGTEVLRKLARWPRQPLRMSSATQDGSRGLEGSSLALAP